MSKLGLYFAGIFLVIIALLLLILGGCYITGKTEDCYVVLLPLLPWIFLIGNRGIVYDLFRLIDGSILVYIVPVVLDTIILYVLGAVIEKAIVLVKPKKEKKKK